MNDLQTLFRHRDEYQFVDVREPFEWEAGRIDGALHVPLAEILAGREQGRVDLSKPVVAVCRSGNRSELARVMLAARGYEAHNMEGGMEEWARQGLPFEAADGSPGRVA
jgi:rhodanese-related sulfurtransferase